MMHPPRGERGVIETPSREAGARGPESLSPLDSRDAWILGLLVLAFLGSRLLWLAWNPGSSIYWEESYRWVAALELLTTPSQPLLHYQADHYQGGSLVMILLALPGLALLGESALVLKLPALLFSTGILATLYLVGRRYFGRPVGGLAALGYLVGPPLVAYWGLVVMGSHHESNLFSLLMISLLLALITRRSRTLGTWTLLGVVAGSGIWFCPTSGQTLLACGLAWLLLERLPRPGELACALGGGLVGLIPWLVYNFQFEFRGVMRVLELFGFGDPVDPWAPQTLWEKLVALVTYDLPVGLTVPTEGTVGPALTALLSIAFAAPLAGALALASARCGRLLRRGLPEPGPASDPEAERTRCELVFILYGGVFLTVFLATRFTVDHTLGIVSYRLFLPPAVLLLLPAARTACLAFAGGGWRRAAAVLAAISALTSSAVATVALAARAPSENQTLSTRTGYVVMGQLAHHKYVRDLSSALEVGRRIPERSVRHEVFQGIGWGMEYRFEKNGDLEQVQRELAGRPLEERAQIIRGMLWAVENRIRFVAGLRAKGGEHVRLQRRLLTLLAFLGDERKRLRADRRTSRSRRGLRSPGERHDRE